jgi:hypothetical protein
MRYLVAILILLLAAADDPGRRTLPPVAGAARAQPKFIPRPFVLVGPPRPTPYTGLKVVTSPRVAVPLSWQEKVAEALNAARPEPPTRAAQFSRMNGKYRIAGWHATVIEAQATPDGWHARLHVSPQVDSNLHGSVTIMDAALEEYQLSNGTLRFLGSTRAPGFGPGVITD